MSHTKSLGLCLAIALLVWFSATAQARGFRVGLTPNGNMNNCATCHVSPAGGGTRNPFGEEVRGLVGSSRDPFWDMALALLDSDDDGFTNGEELGDPDGDGEIDRFVNITNPGIAGDSPVAALGDCNLDTALDANDLVCVSDIPARDAVLEALNTLPGDLDGNGEVGFPDFLVLSANFGSDSTSYADGNIDLAGDIGFPDFLVLSTNFGQTAAAAPVPEPSCSVLAMLGFGAVLGFRRKR